MTEAEALRELAEAMRRWSATVVPGRQPRA
jgi:hypothetical protein